MKILPEKMQEDSFPAAEKILTDIESIFNKDHKLRVFEILPITLNENKSPIVHIEHCLGLEAWCVRHVYSHAYNHIMSIRKNKRKREDPTRINRLLLGVLIINPEITSFWNMRKDLMINKKLDPYFELHFTTVTLSRKPKCAEIFSHRKWVIKKMLKDLPADPGLITNELHICEMAANLYSNNYHAWTHRIWCLSQGNQSSADMIACLQREWLWSENWVSTHVSDYSGFQYRQHLVSKLINLCDNLSFQDNVSEFVDKVNEATEYFFKSVCLKDCVINDKVVALPLRIVVAEFLLSTDLIRSFPGHEALWCHRRFILYSFRESISKLKCSKNTIQMWGYANSNHSKPDGEPLEKDKKIESNCIDRFAMLLNIYEERFIIKYYIELSDSREIEYCNRHKQWLEKVLKMQLPCNLDLLK